jgi:hypothetical protein
MPAYRQAGAICDLKFYSEWILYFFILYRKTLSLMPRLSAARV